MTSQLLDIMSR